METQLLPELPQEIIYNILLKLPVKPLGRFKCVSKPWCTMISGSQFVKEHFNLAAAAGKAKDRLLLSPVSSRTFYSLQVPDFSVAEVQKPCKSGVELEVLGSFNGVILLAIGDDTFFLWNPTTRACQKIVTPTEFLDGIIIFGLGYDSIGEDFKIVRVIKPISAQFHNQTEVLVFSSKSNLWNRIRDFGYKFYVGGAGTIVNGSPHWVVCQDSGTGRDNIVIVYFDPAEERFREVPLPDLERRKWVDLAVLGGCFCALQTLEESVHVWVMKEYNVKESWTKLFVVANVSGGFNFHYIRPVCYVSDDEVEVVMLLSSEKLAVYDIRRGKFNRLIRIPSNLKLIDVVTYVESLVSPGVLRP